MEMGLQRKKVVVLASSIACFSGVGPVLMQHFKGRQYFHLLIIGWSLLIACVLAYTIIEFTKLKRSEHE